MNFSDRQELQNSPDPRAERRLEHADEDARGNIDVVNAMADRLPPSSSAPRIGDRFTLKQDRGNPFADFCAEVTDLKNGYVQYVFAHLSAVFRPCSSLKLETFLDLYEPTPETLAARERGLTLPDWLAYLADQKQAAEDEAREVALNDQNERDRIGHENAQREEPL